MTLNQLPEIKIVRHARSTRLRLRVEPTQIRLTAPVFCSKKQIQNFMDQSEQWLVKTWQEQQQKREIQIQNRVLPTELRLFNLEQPLQLSYQTQKQSFIFDHENLQLVMSDRHPEQYLKAFVIAYAKHHLPVYLTQVSSETALKYGQCAIRQPKTRWGSCTSKHDIMLNSALVFFPKEVVRYVCVHELAHTRYFDHSSQFWAQVQLHDQNFQQHRKILKHEPLPYWWFLGKN
ncbi:hypothetical protein B9T25_12355 [Acinetobacter sp. ANC 4470]|uniref:M48 family metallopeptidase n=1 Tax=Acinetobacter sp. ANC 4470 TaxID=1977881 RepID=UPI000A33C7F3|nr:SprT family zinc-dependent metalloprotease [Acinetobacter sp. ANC 4470]OTG64868.1 hypothetical protein B9T25_12355 [Acinetobacter sp. ANC 4470]